MDIKERYKQSLQSRQAGLHQHPKKYSDSSHDKVSTFRIILLLGSLITKII